MPFALLLAALTAATPLDPQLYEGRLAPPAAVVSPTLGARGGDIYNGVRLTVSGSILTALGTGFGVLGIYGLMGAADATGSTKTVFTALGWTAAGFGMLLGAVGIPLLIVGIVKLSAPRELAWLHVSEQGLLAARF